jgi:hypothetical protein
VLGGLDGRHERSGQSDKTAMAAFGDIAAGVLLSQDDTQVVPQMILDITPCSRTKRKNVVFTYSELRRSPSPKTCPDGSTYERVVAFQCERSMMGPVQGPVACPVTIQALIAEDGVTATGVVVQDVNGVRVLDATPCANDLEKKHVVFAPPFRQSDLTPPPVYCPQDDGTMKKYDRVTLEGQ